MFVKICGVRDVETAMAVAACAPDAIGLNFYPQSARWLDIRMAERITRALPVHIEPVGVFVNHAVDEILEVARNCRMATVQLHGDEPVSVAAELSEAGLDVIRALRIDESNVAALPELIAAYRDVPLKAVLIDARAAGVYGGSGQVAPWEAIAAQWRCEWPPLLIAGGLTADNVAQAVRTLTPWGVDTAGGVESAPAAKDLAKVQRFIDAARARPI